MVSVSKADTESRQTGVDLHMKKDDLELMIEAKGYPSTTYQRGPKQGETKPPKPPNQARKWYSAALLCGMLKQEGHPNSVVAIAFPEKPSFLKLVERTKGSLKKLRLRVLFVTETGDIKVIGDPI